MIATLKTQGLQSREEIHAFLEGAYPLDFDAPGREALYDWIASELRRLGKIDKGLARRYLEKLSGLSRAQMTRLIRQFRDTGSIRDRRGTPARPFPRRCIDADVCLLAEVDTRHGTLSGPATRKPCERTYRVFGDGR